MSIIISFEFPHFFNKQENI